MRKLGMRQVPNEGSVLGNRTDVSDVQISQPAAVQGFFVARRPADHSHVISDNVHGGPYYTQRDAASLTTFTDSLAENIRFLIKRSSLCREQYETRETV